MLAQRRYSIGFGGFGLLARRDLYRATSVGTRGGFPHLVELSVYCVNLMDKCRLSLLAAIFI